MRRLFVAVSLLLLGACNMVMTKTPLLTASDAAGAPRLKPGIWATDVGAGCQYDPKAPLKSWPDCARGMVVEPGSIGAYDTRDDKLVFASADVVLAAGTPRILQVRLTHDNDPGNMDEDGPPQLFIYLAVRPTATDAAGQITAYDSWPTLCGEPPPADAKTPDGSGTRYGTWKPLPGMTMDEQVENCGTTSRDVLRTAAKASEAWTPPDNLNHNRWLRAGDR